MSSADRYPRIYRRSVASGPREIVARVYCRELERAAVRCTAKHFPGLGGVVTYQGVLVTDDFAMEALHSSDGGVGGAAVKSLNAGVDLLLMSFDYEQVYPVLYALMKAQQERRLDLRRMEESRSRLLRRAPELLPRPAFLSQDRCSCRDEDD